MNNPVLFICSIYVLCVYACGMYFRGKAILNSSVNSSWDYFNEDYLGLLMNTLHYFAYLS